MSGYIFSHILSLKVNPLRNCFRHVLQFEPLNEHTLENFQVFQPHLELSVEFQRNPCSESKNCRTGNMKSAQMTKNSNASASNADKNRFQPLPTAERFRPLSSAFRPKVTFQSTERNKNGANRIKRKRQQKNKYLKK